MTKKVFTLLFISDNIIDEERATPRKENIKMKVKNLEGIRGKAIVNQFVIDEGRTTWFQSYDSIIVEINREDEKNNRGV